MPTLFEFAGGIEVLHRLEQTFYDSVLADPLTSLVAQAERWLHAHVLEAASTSTAGT